MGSQLTPEGLHADAMIVSSGPMSRVRYLAASLIWLVFVSPAFAGNKNKAQSDRKLPHDIEAILDDPDSARGFWGIYAVSLKSNQTIFALNEDKLFTPGVECQAVHNRRGVWAHRAELPL